MKRILWTPKSQRGHVELHNLLSCLRDYFCFIRFRCVAGNKHRVNLCKLHCHISQIVHFSLSLQIKAVHCVNQDRLNNLGCQWWIEGMWPLKGYIYHIKLGVMRKAWTPRCLNDTTHKFPWVQTAAKIKLKHSSGGKDASISILIQSGKKDAYSHHIKHKTVGGVCEWA